LLRFTYGIADSYLSQPRKTGILPCLNPWPSISGAKKSAPTCKLLAKTTAFGGLDRKVVIQR